MTGPKGPGAEDAGTLFHDIYPTGKRVRPGGTGVTSPGAPDVGLNEAKEQM